MDAGDFYNVCKKVLKKISPLIFLLELCMVNTLSFGAEPTPAPTPPPSVRKFDDVLLDLFNEFSYDLKVGEVQTVKNASIRKVALSEAIPKSYEGYLESVAIERIRQHSKIRIIQCTVCKVKRSIVENGKLYISLPINNNEELNKIATQMNIETWIDIALMYHETNMILAFNAFDAMSKELIWSKVYSSEALYRKKMQGENEETQASSQTHSTDPKNDKQEGKARGEGRAVLGLSLGYYIIPNIQTKEGMLGLSIRGADLFNKGHSEVGAALVPIVDPNLFLRNYTGVKGDPVQTGEVTADASTKAINPFQYGLGFFANYHHNFFSGIENYDEMRFGVGVGLGIIASLGYLSISAESDILIKFGRYFVLTVGGIFSLPTQISIQNQYTFKTKGGYGGHLSFGIIL